jgi:D-serine deaminase-like pyridoxal phosphate-dependent protein
LKWRLYLNFIESSVMMSERRWYNVSNEDQVFSPSLLVFEERIRENIGRMIAAAGGTSRLRPHVKTHKMPEIVRMQMDQGINKFKCATIAEAEMTAMCGVKDILLAMQPIGPNINRFFELRKAFPGAVIACIADSLSIMEQISGFSTGNGIITDVWIDINTGMDRTGIKPGGEAVSLYRAAAGLRNIRVAGLHAYDGHIHEKEFGKRKEISDKAFQPVERMKRELESEGPGPVGIIAGGSPTFPVHVLRNDVELSPGTILLWDYGYSSRFSDMDYLHAAVLLARVVSRPGPDLICIDLGHKAVGSEMAQPRVFFPDIKEYIIAGHNEEHMVISTPEAGQFTPGDVVYAVPWHICPTVDRYDQAYVVRAGRVCDVWNIEARKRKITC